MGYNIEVQSNPHSFEPPSYSEKDGVSNVDTLMIPDDGPEARLLHELVGMAVLRGDSLDKREAEDLHGRVEHLRKEVEGEQRRAPVPSPLRDGDENDDQGAR